MSLTADWQLPSCVCSGGGESYNPLSAGVVEIKIHLLRSVLRMGKESASRGG